ncbi:hypothetical protein K3495_g9994 [Podosphaera aphanis]|nr:hypothetical protein K3495_g9994 [Podosphaera aphanis]
MYKVLLVLAAVVVNAADHIVKVGGNGTKTFSPNSITVPVGDHVMFKFFEKSIGHSVVTSSFKKPCTIYGRTSSSELVYGDDNGVTTYVVDVNSTDPIWYYSDINSDCIEGMVGVINPPNDTAILDYIKRAKSAIEDMSEKDVKDGAVTSEAAPFLTFGPAFSAETTMPTATMSATTDDEWSLDASSLAEIAASKNTGSKRSFHSAQNLGFVIGGLIALMV